MDLFLLGFPVLSLSDVIYSPKNESFCDRDCEAKGYWEVHKLSYI